MAIELSTQSVPANPPASFLEVRDLRVHFPTEDGLVKSVDGVSFSLEKNKSDVRCVTRSTDCSELA